MFCFAVTVLVWTGSIISGKKAVAEEWGWTSITKSADSGKLQQDLVQICSLDEARAYLSAALPKLLDAVNFDMDQAEAEHSCTTPQSEGIICFLKRIVHRVTDVIEP